MAKASRREPALRQEQDPVVKKISSADINYILSALPAEDYAALTPHLETMTFEPRQKVEEPFVAPSHVHFILSGILSMLAVSDKTRLEIGLVGREGMTGYSVVMDVEQAPYELFAQLSGKSLRIETPILKKLLIQRPSMHRVFLRYFYVQNVQTSCTAVANRLNKVEERLARWILMAHDRSDRDELLLTHEFLSLMLGVRRAGITVALHVLEGEGLIKSLRNRVIVKNRKGLLKYANGIYGMPEAEAKRLGFGAAAVG